MKDAAKEKPTRKYTGINAYIGREKQFQMNNKSYTLRIFIKEEQTNTKEQREGIIIHIWQNSTCIFNLNIFFRKLGVEKKKKPASIWKRTSAKIYNHIIFYSENWVGITLRTLYRCSFFSHLLKNVWKVIASAIWQGKEMKDFSIEGKKKAKKLFLFLSDIFVFVQNP